MLNEAKTSKPRPRPELRYRGRGQFREVEAKAEAKKVMKKDQIMINNIRFKIIVGKINKIPEFYTIFAPQNDRLYNKTTRLRLGKGQMFEAEAEATLA